MDICALYKILSFPVYCTLMLCVYGFPSFFWDSKMCYYSRFKLTGLENSISASVNNQIFLFFHQILNPLCT